MKKTFLKAFTAVIAGVEGTVQDKGKKEEAGHSGGF